MVSLRILPAALAILVASMLPAARAQAVNALRRPPAQCVANDAGVLSKAVMLHIDAMCAEVEQRMHIQMAVVAMKTTGEIPLAAYAQEVRTTWALGARDSGRGILILAPLSDRAWSITGTPAMQSLLPQASIQAIGERTQRFLRISQNDEGMTSATQDVAMLLASENGITLATPRWSLPFPHHKPLAVRQKLLLLILAILCLTLLWRVLPALRGEN